MNCNLEALKLSIERYRGTSAIAVKDELILQSAKEYATFIKLGEEDNSVSEPSKPKRVATSRKS